MSKNVKSLTNREQLEKMEKMERKLQEFELQNNAVQVIHINFFRKSGFEKEHKLNLIF